MLGYEVFSFEFETTQLTEYNGKECIGITRGTINVGHSIKRQKISDMFSDAYIGSDPFTLIT